VKRGTVRVKCLAQEHETVTWPRLEPAMFDPELVQRTTHQKTVLLTITFPIKTKRILEHEKARLAHFDSNKFSNLPSTLGRTQYDEFPRSY